MQCCSSSDYAIPRMIRCSYESSVLMDENLYLPPSLSLSLRLSLNTMHDSLLE